MAGAGTRDNTDVPQRVDATPGRGDLARLLETERRLEERLRAAGAEAETVVARAQLEAERQEATLEAELAEAGRRLDESLAAEDRRRAAEIADAAAREVEAYGRVTPARLAAVAFRSCSASPGLPLTLAPRSRRPARRAYPALLGALALHGRTGLRAIAWPARDLTVAVEPGSVWGIVVSRITARPPLVRTLAARAAAPGLTGPAAVRAALDFERLADLLLDAAPREMLIRRLGEALAQTSRQVNTLERRLAPALRTEVTGMRRALDEREREERLRLKQLITRWRGR